jgi:hypothetical protein
LHGTNLNHVAPDGLPNCVEMTFAAGAAPSNAKLRSSLPLVGLDSPNKPNQPDRHIRFNRQGPHLRDECLNENK